MNTIKVGDKLPAMTVMTTSNYHFKMHNLLGKNLVLFFYPKNWSPGCLLEGKAFSDNYKKFQSLQTEVLGVSRDGIKSHIMYKNKLKLPFELISDASSELSDRFDVLLKTELFGKELSMISRSTFIFDSEGKLRHALRGVSARKHVNKVLTLVKGLI